MNSNPLDSDSSVNNMGAHSKQENLAKEDTLIEDQREEKKQQEEDENKELEQNDFSKGLQESSSPPDTTDPTKRELSRPSQFEIEMANKEMFHFFSLRKMNKGTIKLPERVSTFRAEAHKATTALPGSLSTSILTSRLHPFTNHQLMYVLQEKSKGLYSGIVYWSQDGKSVIVNKPEAFEEVVLPTYFNNKQKSTFDSFARKMRRWGFATRRVKINSRSGRKNSEDMAALVGDHHSDNVQSVDDSENGTYWIFDHPLFLESEGYKCCPKIETTSTSRHRQNGILPTNSFYGGGGMKNQELSSSYLDRASSHQLHQESYASRRNTAGMSYPSNSLYKPASEPNGPSFDHYQQGTLSYQQTRNQHGIQQVVSRGGLFINGRNESPLNPLVAPSPYTPASQFKEVLAQRRELLSKHRDEQLRSTDSHFQSNPIARMEPMGQNTNFSHSLGRTGTVNNSAPPQEYRNSGFSLNNKNYNSSFQNNQLAMSRDPMFYSNDQEIYQSREIPQRANMIPAIMRGRQQFRPNEQEFSRMMSAPPQQTRRMIQQNYNPNLNGNVQSYHSATTFVNVRGMQTENGRRNNLQQHEMM